MFCTLSLYLFCLSLNPSHKREGLNQMNFIFYTPFSLGIRGKGDEAIAQIC